MTAQTKTTIKSYFETGDQPTQSQFSDFIDSYQDANILLSTITSASTGLLILASANGVVGRSLTGTSNEITINNPNGVNGSPTFGLPGTLAFAGKIVTGGTFVSAAVSGCDIRHGTIVSAAITSPTVAGLLDISGATAGQIKFPAAQNASSNANTLDDYEEGTWTPVLTFATPGNLSTAYSTQFGAYTKIGRLVIAQFRLNLSTFTHTTASGNLQITGLPFAQNNTAGFDASGALEAWQGITKANYTQMSPALAAGAQLLTITACGQGQNSATIAFGDTPTGGAVILRGFIAYHV